MFKEKSLDDYILGEHNQSPKGYIKSRDGTLLIEWDDLVPCYFSKPNYRAIINGVGVLRNYVQYNDRSDRRCYLMDHEFKIIETEPFDSIGDEWYGTHLPAWQGDRFGFINDRGEWVTPPEIKEIDGHTDNTDWPFLLAKSNGLLGIYGLDMEQILPFAYDEIDIMYQSYNSFFWHCPDSVNLWFERGYEYVLKVMDTHGKYGFLYALNRADNSGGARWAFTGCIYDLTPDGDCDEYGADVFLNGVQMMVECRFEFSTIRELDETGLKVTREWDLKSSEGLSK